MRPVTSMTGVRSRAAADASASDMPSHRVGAIVMPLDVKPVRAPRWSGSISTTTPHAFGSRWRADETHTNEMPDAAPDSSNGIRRRRSTGHVSSITTSTAGRVRPSPRPPRSASRSLTIVSAWCDVEASCPPPRLRAWGSHFRNVQSCMPPSPTSATTARSVGLCIVAACITSERARARVACSGPARPTPRCARTSTASGTSSSSRKRSGMRSTSARRSRSPPLATVTAVRDGSSAVPSRSRRKSGSSGARSHRRSDSVRTSGCSSPAPGVSRKRLRTSSTRSASNIATCSASSWRCSASFSLNSNTPLRLASIQLPMSRIGDSSMNTAPSGPSQKYMPMPSTTGIAAEIAGSRCLRGRSGGAGSSTLVPP